MPSNFSIAIAILTHLRRFSMRVFSAFLKQAGVMNQGILKGGSITVLYDYRQYLFLFTKQANQNLSNRRSMVQWYFPLLVFPGLNESSW